MDLLLVVFHQFFHLFRHPCLDEGKPATPFLPSQGGKVHFSPLQDLDKGLGNLLDQGKEGGHTSHEVDYPCLLPLIHVIRGVPQEFYP